VIFEDAAVLILERESAAPFCLHSFPKSVARKRIPSISAALCFLKFIARKCSEGLEARGAGQRAAAARASSPPAVLVQTSGELSLAFAVAAQCDVVESVLNK